MGYIHLDPISPDLKTLSSLLKQGFEMLRSCLPEFAFNGRGREQGPHAILTDNCKEERNALKSVYNGLIDKLTSDLEDHYKNKLLSIADGSYDGVYRHRFMGKRKGWKHRL